MSFYTSYLSVLFFIFKGLLIGFELINNFLSSKNTLTMIKDLVKVEEIYRLKGAAAKKYGATQNNSNERIKP